MIEDSTNRDVSDFVSETIAKRLDIYRTKLHEADPFRPESMNRWEALQYVVAAIELIQRELGIQETQ